MTDKEYNEIITKKADSIDAIKLAAAIEYHYEHCILLFSERKCTKCPYYDICSRTGNGWAADAKMLIIWKTNPSLLLKGEQDTKQETSQPVRESTSDFVRFKKGKTVFVINRQRIIVASFNPANDRTYMKLAGEDDPRVYDGNIIDKIIGGEW